MRITTIKSDLEKTNVAFMSKDYLKKIDKAFRKKDPDRDRRDIGYKIFSMLNPDNEFYFPNDKEGNKVRIAINNITTALNFLEQEIKNLTDTELKILNTSHWYNKNTFNNLLEVLEFAAKYRTAAHEYDSMADYKIIDAETTIIRATYYLQNEPVPIRIYGALDIIFRSLIKIIKEVKNV